MRYMCWDPDDADESEAKPVDGFSPEDAARVFAERRYPSCDFPAHQTILVRDTYQVLHAFDVAAIAEVTFRATPMPVGRGDEEVRHA